MGRAFVYMVAAAMALTVAGGCQAARAPSSRPSANWSPAAQPSALATNWPWLIRTVAPGPLVATQVNISPPCAMAAGGGSLYLAGIGLSGEPVLRVSSATDRLAIAAGFGQGGSLSPDGTIATKA